MSTRLVRESLNEMNFERQSDNVFKNLRIGRKVRIEDWLNQFKSDRIKDVKINEDMTIDAYYVDFANISIKEFPLYINFNHITQYFDVRDCDLITLRGCPKKVGGSSLVVTTS